MDTASIIPETWDTALIVSVVAIFVLLVFSGFFSGSETALTAASRARMHQLKKNGNRRAGLVSRLIDRKERLIGAILLGNNLVNILATALTTSVLTVLLGDGAVAVATVLMTVLVLIFSEVLPKTYAIRRPDRMALAVAPVIAPIVWLLSPATLAVQMIVRMTLRLFGVNVSADQNVDVSEELKGQLELHASEGGMRKMAKDMMGSILELDDVFVSEIMVHRRRMLTLRADTPPADLVAEALASPYTRIPLWLDDQDNIIGVLHAKDLARALDRANGDANQLDIAAIARDPWFVPETTSLREQLTAFRARHAHFAIVVDEYGVVMGIVTLEDILEEIVGDISDEHDAVTPGVTIRPDGTYDIEGTVTLRDLNRRFEWNLPDDEAATIAGLVIHEAQILPDPGQTFRFHGFTFEVLERRRNRINHLRVTPPLTRSAGRDS